MTGHRAIKMIHALDGYNNNLTFFLIATCIVSAIAIARSQSCSPADSLVCPAVANLLYDPCDCAPGFWCGCSSTNQADCDPLAPGTQWVGVTIVNGSLYPSDPKIQENYKCPETFYCPGRNNTQTCPDLCLEGYYCPTPDKIIVCPAGKFCPIGTVNPINCPPLSSPCREGTILFSQLPALILSVVVGLVSSLGLLIGSWLLKKKLTKPIPAEKIKNENDEDTVYSFHENTNIIPNEKRLNFEFENLRLQLKNGPCILKGVTGKLPSGQLTAVMGPSGAGKTTFLSVFSGKQDRTEGTLLINGKPDEIYNYRRVVGFVPQEDVMYRELTVYENIILHAKVRLPKAWKWEKKKKFVDHTIKVLGLENIKNSIIGDENKRGISGGQRKRVNIAMELVADPTVLYLDEPTSGLDSTSSSVVIEALKHAASRGVNCVSVLHQPRYEIYSLFDQLLLLGIGGRTVFMGSPKEAEKYFQEQGFECPPFVNPADFFMDIIAGLVPRKNDSSFKKEDLYEMWNERAAALGNAAESRISLDEDAHDEKSNSISAKYSNFFVKQYHECKDVIHHMFKRDSSKTLRTTEGWFGQYTAFYIRAWQKRLHHPVSTIIFIVACAIAGVILGWSYTDITIYQGIPLAMTEDNPLWYELLSKNYVIQDVVSYLVLFFWTIALLVATTAGVTMFGFHRVQFFREMSVGMSSSAYFFAVWTETFPWLVINALIYTGCFQGILNLRQGFGSIYVVALCIFIGFYSMGILSSILVSRENMNIVAVISGIVVVVIFTGATPKIGSLSSGFKWIWYLFFTFWTASAFTTAEYEQYQPPYNVVLLNDINNPWGEVYGLGFDLFHYSLNVALGYITVLAISVITLGVLKIKDYKRQR